MDNLQEIDSLQLDYVELWHKQEPANDKDGLLGIVCNQHLQNFLLWHEEDKARDPSAKDSTIAQVKRNIDGYNQKRNDLIEKIDEVILTWLFENKIEQNQEAPLLSETFGSMVDRCSIMSLKVYHMSEEANRKDAGVEHCEKAAKKMEVLILQRSDLFNTMLVNFKEMVDGTRQFKIYRQFKMYNDPTLNPKIYTK